MGSVSEEGGPPILLLWFVGFSWHLFRVSPSHSPRRLFVSARPFTKETSALRQDCKPRAPTSRLPDQSLKRRVPILRLSPAGGLGHIPNVSRSVHRPCPKPRHPSLPPRPLSLPLYPLAPRRRIIQILVKRNPTVLGPRNIPRKRIIPQRQRRLPKIRRK